ncbi:MAG: zf-TFIIB domain-containing protein [Pseudomonadota bacterium]
MKCPIDGTDLMMSERNGVEIDYCPSCRGVWLDRGELDKIIERNATSAPPPPPQQQAHRGGRGYDERPRKRKASSFLDDLFDF